MKTIIENEFINGKGIHIENELMDNKEERFRIKLSDFSGVNITTASDNPGWQNAHFMNTVKNFMQFKK